MSTDEQKTGSDAAPPAATRPAVSQTRRLFRIVKRIVLVLLVGAAIPGAWYGVIAYRYWNNPPKITRNYSEELNAPLRLVPENERAWPVYREVMTKLPRTSADASLRVRECQTVPFVAPDRPKAAAMLRREAAMLERVRTAARLKSMGQLLSTETSREDKAFNARHADNYNRPRKEQEAPEPPAENPPLSYVVLRPTGELQELVNLLAADACVAARDKDARRMVDDLSAMIGIAEQLREIPFAICDAVSARRFGEAMRTWGYLMETSPELFDEAALVRLATQARSYAGGGDIRLRLETERLFFADILQRCYTDDGNGDGTFFIATARDAGLQRFGKLDFEDRVEAPLRAGRYASRREEAAEFDRIMTIAEAEVRRSLWQCNVWRHRSEAGAVWKDSRFTAIRFALPEYQTMHRVIEEAVQHRDAMLSVAALLRYRRKHDRWPDKLDSLMPALLADPPTDRLNGGVLGYRVVEGKPFLYSVGSDGVDHGVVDAVQAFIDENFDPYDDPRCWNLSDDVVSLGLDLVYWPVISPKELADGRTLVEKEPDDEGVTPP